MAGALIGALRVSLSAETSAFEAGMKRSQRTAQTTANSISSSFKQAGGAMGALKAGVAGFIASLSIGTVIAAGKAALDYAGSLGEVSQQLGVTTRDLQVFRYAAGQVGVSQDQLETGLGKLTITLGQLAAGAAAPRNALEGVRKGMADQVLAAKDSGEAFRIIADGLKNIGARSERAAVEVALFGKSGAKLDNLLAGGSAAINELADAADRLGIVLSDEQIQKADDTADKLEALQTVLKAKIASSVADNADAILKLADTLAELISWAGRAEVAWSSFMTSLTRQYSIPALFNKFAKGEVYGFNTAGQSVTVPLGAATPAPRQRAVGGASVGQFLSSGGGGGRRRSGGRGDADDAERKRMEALRDAHQFEDDIRRAQMDVLEAMRDLSTDAIERYNISVQIKDAEKAAYEAELRYQVAAGELSQAQADQLEIEYDKKDSLERQKMIADESERAAESSSRLDMLSLNLQEDDLRTQLQLAKTAAEARDISLRLLDIARQKEQAAIDELAASKDIADQEEARRRQLALNAGYGNARQAVLNQTNGPLEDFFSRLPMDAKEYNEALESVAANGLQSLEDGLVDVLMGTKSLKEAFHQMAAQMLADLLRLAIQKYVIGSIMKAVGITGGFADGGLVPGFAYGGFVSGPGGPREDKVPAMLSAGEFVINSKATKKFLPLLQRINSGDIGRLAMGGLSVPRAAYHSRAGAPNGSGYGAPMKIEMHNDFRGADQSSVAAIQARLNQMEAEFPGKVVSTMQDAKERLVWRSDRR